MYDGLDRSLKKKSVFGLRIVAPALLVFKARFGCGACVFGADSTFAHQQSKGSTSCIVVYVVFELLSFLFPTVQPGCCLIF